MSDNDNAVEDKEKAKLFVEGYNKLVSDTGYQLVINPAYKRNENGEFVTVLQTSVGKVVKKES